MTKMREAAAKLFSRFVNSSFVQEDRKVAVELQILTLLQVEETNTLLKQQNELLKKLVKE